MSTIEDLRNDLATNRAHLDGRFDQMKIELCQMKTEISLMKMEFWTELSQIKTEVTQLKAEMKAEMGQLKAQMNHRMDALAEMVELGRQLQQNPVEDSGQVNEERVDGAINNGGDEGQDGQEDDDQQDAISVKSEIDSGSCQSDCDYGMSEDIVVKEEEAGDSGTGGQQQQPEDQAPTQPVAGPSGISRAALKRPQANPPRRSTRLASSSQRRPNLSESGDTSDEEETTAPSTKKARTTTSSKSAYRQRCPHCSQMVTNLTTHARTHTGERPYVCQHAHCGKAYTQSNGLNYHLRQHHKEKVKVKPRCEQCGKHFVNSTVLARHHLRLHTRERPYRCPRPGCDYASVQKYDIDQHLLTKKHRDQ